MSGVQENRPSEASFHTPGTKYKVGSYPAGPPKRSPILTSDQEEKTPDPLPLGPVPPPENYDEPVMSIRESVVLAIEAARAGQQNGAAQVIRNLRKKYGEVLVPPQDEPILPQDAIPFYLSWGKGDRDEGKPLPAEVEFEASDEVILENYNTLAQWGREWLEYMGRCAHLIHADHDRLGEKCQAHELDLSQVEDPTQAVVVGSGSSLDDLSSLLPAFPGLIVCGASNASNVIAHGGRPHAILSVDSGLGTVLHLSSVPYDSMGIPLIVPTAMHPDVPALFPNHRLWFTSVIQMARGAQHPFNIFSHMLFPFIKSMMFQAGCTINAEILLLNLLQEMSKAKFNAVYLLGCDFAYKKNASRCSAYRKMPDGSFKKGDINTSSKAIQTSSPIRRSANGLVTDETMIGYKRSLLTVWVMSQLPLYDASNGIITEVPKVDFIELAEDGFRGRPPSYGIEEIVAAYNRYLTRVGYVPGKVVGSEGREIQGELW